MSEPPKKNQEEPTLIGGVPVYVASTQKPACLRQVKGPGAPRDLLLELPETVIGRALEANVYIDSPSVSRSHARVLLSDSGYTIEDLGSGNGVYVNGERRESVALHAGDTIQLGDALFVFEYAKPSG